MNKSGAFALCVGGVKTGHLKLADVFYIMVLVGVHGARLGVLLMLDACVLKKPLRHKTF